MRKRLPALVTIVVAIMLVSACAAGRAYRRGDVAARGGDWEAAVAYYTRAVQEAPERAEYKIALQRAMQNASRDYLTQARHQEEEGHVEGALFAYRKALEYDPTNRQAALKVSTLERTIRDRIEAARPRPPIERMRQQARQAAAAPLLNPASREPLRITFTNASLKDILAFIADATGINVTYDPQFRDVPYTVSLDGVTLEEALNQILAANNYWYKVINERTIMVIPETPQKRAQYEEQVIRVFYLSHADATELSQVINTVIRVPQMPVQPTIFPNKTANTITVRATTAVANVIERIIAANDKPRAEIVIDVQILEVSRQRAKQYGLNLTQYALGGIFSPELAPPNQPTPPEGVSSPPPFNLNTISQGVSTADFYAAVPAAVLRFLESDNRTRLIAKPQLRGMEGTRLTLNLGDEIPVPTTTFGSVAAGGLATVPVSSFQYRPVGVNIEMTPRVTYEGEIVLELLVESSTLGASITVAGQSAPTFGSRKVTTRLRLREGESNLLAGLLREDERRSLQGFPGAIRVPILRQLFSGNVENIEQTDIVMLLTPHIVRTHELTQEDLSPIHIGTQQNIGLTGPPPLIAAQPFAEPEPAPAVPDDPDAPAAPIAPPVAPGVPDPAAAPGVPAPPPGTPDPAPAAPVGLPRPPGAAAPGVPGTPTPLPPVPAEPEPTPEPEPPAPGEPVPPPAATTHVLVTPPGTEFRLGGGPYTVPITIAGASRLSVVTLTLTYNPAVLSVRTVQEGSFMRQGGVGAVFTRQVDPAAGRVDISITRPGEATGATGSGLLAALIFDAMGEGSATLALSGVATAADGTPLAVQFGQATVTVR